jgi:Flp pilus assembly secretin CpaC
MSFRGSFKWVACLGIALMSWGSLASQASAANEERIEMFTGDTHVLEVNAQRVAVGNGRIVSARPIEGHRILLLAESAGVSSLQVWTRDGARLRYLVNVLEFSGAPLYEQVQRLLEGTRQIGVRLVGDRIVLEGHRVSDTDRERAAAIVKAYPGRVFDFIDRVGWDAMIHLQVTILEVRHSALDSLGIRWDSVMQGPTLTVDSARGAGSYARLEWNSQLTSLIELLRQRGEARIVATPTLSCRSGGEAHFVAGGELPIPVTNGQGSPSVQYREYGVILDVRPVADDAGNVYARVETEVNDVDRAVEVLGVPAILKRHSNTEVNVRAGETIVIAGLVSRASSSQRHGVPFLSALPGLGKLFQSHDHEQQESELVVFITPHIVAALPAPPTSADPGLEQLERADQLLRATPPQ